MTYQDLYEICQQYGLKVDFNIEGQWAIKDPVPGSGYRVYVWEIGPGGDWPIKVLRKVGMKELKEMSREEMEDMIISCAIEALA